MDFNQWISDASRTEDEIWKRHGQIIIGMGKVFIELSGAIINYLKSMHEGDKYNGKLLTTMQITSISVGLKLSFKIDGPVNVSHDPTVVRDGIMKDILDLRSMVRTAGRRFRQNQYPPVWNLFLHHNYNPQHFRPRTMRDIKKVALFNYTHPVFFDSVNMAKFIFKIHEIRKKNDRDFDCYVRLNFHPVDMRGWERRILLNAHLPDYDPHQSPLRHVLYYRNNPTAPTPPLQIRFRYLPPYGVTPYLRIVLAHCDDHQPQAIWLGRTVKELHEIFPDVLAKIHYLLVDQFYDDLFCNKKFGANLPKLLRHGPYGFKGLKL